LTKRQTHKGWVTKSQLALVVSQPFDLDEFVS
jgi:hypothetical protein